MSSFLPPIDSVPRTPSRMRSHESAYAPQQALPSLAPFQTQQQIQQQVQQLTSLHPLPALPAGFAAPPRSQQYQQQQQPHQAHQQHYLYQQPAEQEQQQQQQQQQQRHVDPADAQEEFGRVVGAAVTDLVHFKHEARRKDAIIHGLQEELAVTRQSLQQYAEIAQTGAGFQRECDSLRMRVHELTAERTRTHQDLDHFQNELRRLQEELVQTRTSRTDLESRLRDESRKLEEAEARAKLCQEQAEANLSATKQDLEAAVSELRTALQLAQRSLADLSASRDRDLAVAQEALLTANTQAQAEALRAEMQLTELREQVAAFTSSSESLDRLAQALDEREKQNGALQEALDAASSQYTSSLEAARTSHNDMLQALLTACALPPSAQDPVEAITTKIRSALAELDLLRSETSENGRTCEALAAATRTVALQLQSARTFICEGGESLRPLLDLLRLTDASIGTETSTTASLFREEIAPTIQAIVEWCQSKLTSTHDSMAQDTIAQRTLLEDEIQNLRSSRSALSEQLERMQAGLRALIPGVQGGTDNLLDLLQTHIDHLHELHSQQGHTATSERAELHDSLVLLRRELADEKQAAAERTRNREGEYQTQLEALQKAASLAAAERDALRSSLEERDERIRLQDDRTRSLEDDLSLRVSSTLALEQRAAASSQRILQLESDVEGLRNDAFTRMSRIKDLEGELHVLHASANCDISVAQGDIQQLSLAVSQLKQSKAELQQLVVALQRRIAEGEDQQNLRTKERNIALLKRDVASLQARLTDVRSEVGDALKSRALDLEADLRVAQANLERTAQADKDSRQQLAVLNSTMVAKMGVKDSIIQALEAKIKVLEAADNVAQQYQGEIAGLKEQIALLREQLEQQDLQLKEAKERIEFLEATKLDAKNQNMSRMETQLEAEMRKIDALKQAAKEDALALKELRTKAMQDEVAVARLQDDLQTQTKEAQHFQDMMHMALKTCIQMASEVQALLKLDSDPLHADAILSRELAPAAAIEEWSGLCAQHNAEVARAVSKLQEAVASIPDQLQAQEKAFNEQREKLRESLEKRMEQIKIKLSRKDELLANYDGDLEQMKEFKSKAAAAESTIRGLTSENERLLKKVAEQRQAIVEVEGRLEDQKQLCEALAKRKDVAQAFSQSLDRNPLVATTASTTPAAPSTNAAARRQAEDLKEQLVQQKNEHAQRIKQKNVLIMTLRRQMKALGDKALVGESGQSDKSMLHDLMLQDTNMEDPISL